MAFKLECYAKIFGSILLACFNVINVIVSKLQVMKTSFLVIRHQAVENPENIFYGVSRDLPISKEGREKARQMGKRLRDVGISPSVIYVSNLIRAQQTAREIQQGIGNHIPIEIDSGLADVSYPSFEGKAVNKKGQINLGEGKIVSLDQLDEYSAETAIEAGTRFANTLRNIAQWHQGKLVGIVSHGDPIAWGLEFIRHGENANFSMKRLMDRDSYPAKGDIALIRFNPDGSLYGDVTFRPEIDQIPSILEIGLVGKKR